MSDYSFNPSRIEWDLTKGPLSKLLELLDILDTQVFSESVKRGSCGSDLLDLKQTSTWKSDTKFKQNNSVFGDVPNLVDHKIAVFSNNPPEKLEMKHCISVTTIHLPPCGCIFLLMANIGTLPEKRTNIT